MATWYVFGHTTTGTAFATNSANSAWKLLIGANSAIAFGGTNRSTFNAAIQIGSYNEATHRASGATAGATDQCPSPHLNTLKWIAGTTANANNGSNRKMGTSFPTRAHGFQFKLGLTTSVAVNPCQIWNGSGASALSAPDNIVVQFVELRVNSPASWSAASVTGKLSLANKSAATGHSWHIGLSAKPLSVGFEGDNKLRIEATYS